MHEIAPWHDHEYEGLSVQLSVMDLDAEGRLYGIGAYLVQQPAKGRHLLERHPLNLSGIGDSAKKHAPVCVRERCHFIGEIPSAGALRTVATEFDLLELPAVVLAQPQTAADCRVGNIHEIPPAFMWPSPSKRSAS